MNEKSTSPSLDGLTAAEVADRIQRGLVNRVRRSDRAEYADIVRRNVLTLFNALVAPAAVALFALRDFWAALAVSGMVVTNTFLALVQEIRAKKHLDRLTLLSEAKVHVVRDRQVREIASGDVVQDDRVLLAAGDPIVADGAVIESRYLEVDEALLTGESDPVARGVGERVLSGSFCVAGEGAYQAEQVGADAFAQKTSTEARAYRHTPSLLQKSIDRLIEILTAVAVLMSLSYVGLYFARGTIGNDQLLRMIAATITSMVPQGLVLMATLAFILGAIRLSARGAIVNRLDAVETMASIDTLCMDKTGTLTTNQFQLAQLRLTTPHMSAEEVRFRLSLFASCSLDQGNKSLSAIRSAVGETHGELIDQLPFKSQNRYSAVRVRSGAGEYTLVLGAPEAVKLMLIADPGPWEESWQELKDSGMRLLLFAEVQSGPNRFAKSLDGFTLRPLALIALKDELRPEAAEVLHGLAAQGIAFKILSGDNPDTVRATIAPLAAFSDSSALAALAENNVVSGSQLELSDDADELIRTRTVFGRVSPRQKVQIVQTLKEQGNRVAMLGDGVNDVLPIKNANLGIAMGDGSRASKIVASLVLQTNDFALLPECLDEGRTILRNIRRAAKLFLVKNLYTFLLIVAALGMFNLPFPFVPQQVTLLNSLTIGIPAILVMFGRQRSAAATVPDCLREIGSFVLRTGILTGAAGIAVMLISARLLADGERTQTTMLLSVLIVLGAVNLWRTLLDGEKGWLRGDQVLRSLPLVTVPVYLLAMYLPGTGRIFELAALDFVRWAWVAGVAGIAWAMMWFCDRVSRRSARQILASRAP